MNQSSFVFLLPYPASNIKTATSSAVAQETRVKSLALKAIFTRVLSTQQNTAHFLMLHVELEASSILARLQVGISHIVNPSLMSVFGSRASW